MLSFLTPARIAAIATFSAGLAAFILGVVQIFPQSWQNYALAAAGLLTKLATGLKFLHGSQQWDKLTAGASIPTAHEVERAALRDVAAFVGSLSTSPTTPTPIPAVAAASVTPPAPPTVPPAA